MISSAHSSDKKVIQISELNKLKRELRILERNFSQLETNPTQLSIISENKLNSE